MSDVLAVVIPAFRCEQTINATLDSVLAQRRKADKVVIVVDEPNPNLVAMCRAHEINAEVISNKNNLGVAATRNIGFNRLRHNADLISFLDSDDILHPDFFAMACEQFGSYPDTDAVFGKFELWHEGTPKAPLPPLSTKGISLRKDALNAYLSNTGGYLLSFALLRMSSITEVSVDGKFNIERLRNNQDFEFICRLFFQGNIIRLNDRCGWHRKMPGSLSSNQARAWYFRSVAARLLYTWFDSKNAEKALLKRMKQMEHSAARRSARLFWEGGKRKEATKLLCNSITKLQLKSFVQLVLLYLGVSQPLIRKYKK